MYHPALSTRAWLRLISALLLLVSQGYAQTAPSTSPQPTAVSNLPPVVPPSPAEAAIPVANPGRPTVSNPATLPPVGYLQFEQGFVQADTSPGDLAQQFSVNQTVKLAVLPRLMFAFSWQPVAVTRLMSAHTEPVSSSDLGDLQSSIQAVVLNGSDRSPTLSISYARRLRTGTAPDLDIGGFSQSAILYLSGNTHRFHYDSNFVLAEQTQARQAPPAPTLRRAQFGQTLSVAHELFAHPLHDDLTLSVELWHFSQPLVTSTRSGLASPRSNAVGALAAFGYTLRPNLVFDGGLDHGLTSTSSDWQGFAGFTYLLPHRLWPRTSHR